MIHITRRERFSAAHVLRNDKWDEQKNIEIFGKCANKNWHGHNFELFVTVKGNINEETGFVINLKDLSKESIESLNKEAKDGLTKQDLTDHDRYVLNQQLDVLKEIRV